MHNLSDMIWIETRKAIRSRMPLWTGLGSLFMPLGIAFLIFLSKNPEISHKLGLVSAKADLIAYSATDWPAYLSFFGMIVAAGGFFLFTLVISWVFGREFADDTLKDMLAVPVQRASILLAKFIVTAIWSAGLTIIIYIAGLVTGAAIRLPGEALSAIFQHSNLILVTGCMVIALVFPFAFFASIGRGYLLPLSIAVLTVMVGNLVAVLGWEEYFPWGVPGIYAQAKGALPAASYWIVFLTGAGGILATYYWWKYADQNR